MLEELKRDVCEANKELSRLGLARFTWGNASGLDRGRGLAVIKPSGVAYGALTPGDMAVLDLETGKRVEGALAPSSDTATHLCIYRAFPSVCGVVHTHSRFATAFAQALRAVPVLGTTHCDCFYGDVPCTREMTPGEIEGEYEENTGALIAETFRGKSCEDVPAVLVAGHGPFAWGKSVEDAVHSAAALEEVAFLAWHTLALSPCARPVCGELLDRHFKRKHGEGAYYGQR